MKKELVAKNFGLYKSRSYKSGIHKEINRYKRKLYTENRLKGMSHPDACEVAGYHRYTTERDVRKEVDEALRINGVTVDRLVLKIKDGLDALETIYVGKDADPREREDRQHQRWTWEQAAELLGIKRKEALTLGLNLNLTPEQAQDMLGRINTLKEELNEEARISGRPDTESEVLHHEKPKSGRRRK